MYFYISVFVEFLKKIRQMRFFVLFLLFNLSLIFLSSCSSWLYGLSMQQIIPDARYITIHDLLYSPAEKKGSFVVIEGRIKIKTNEDIYMIEDMTGANHITISSNIMKIKDGDFRVFDKLFIFLVYTEKNNFTGATELFVISRLSKFMKNENKVEISLNEINILFNEYGIIYQ